MQRAYELLSILQSYAPNKHAQQKAANVYNEMRDANWSSKEVELSLVGFISHGLTTDIWPWSDAFKK